jgi:outer membrane biosynthesis protein TonB
MRGRPGKRRAGAAGFAGVFLVTVLVFGTAASLAVAAQASPTATPSGSAATAATSPAASWTGPAPDPQPPQPPQPDPKPSEPARTTPPPPPAPPPPSSPPASPKPAQPTPTTQAPAATTSPVQATPPPSVDKSPSPVAGGHARKPQTSAPRARRTAVRAEAQHVERTRASRRAEGGLPEATVALTLPTGSAPAGAGTVLVFAALVGFGLLLLGTSAVPPRRVPWPVIAEPLILHRSRLAVSGIATIAIALMFLNVAVLL